MTCRPISDQRDLDHGLGQIFLETNLFYQGILPGRETSACR